MSARFLSNLLSDSVKRKCTQLFKLCFTTRAEGRMTQEEEEQHDSWRLQRSRKKCLMQNFVQTGLLFPLNLSNIE